MLPLSLGGEMFALSPPMLSAWGLGHQMVLRLMRGLWGAVLHGPLTLHGQVCRSSEETVPFASSCLVTCVCQLQFILCKVAFLCPTFPGVFLGYNTGENDILYQLCFLQPQLSWKVAPTAWVELVVPHLVFCRYRVSLCIPDYLGTYYIDQTDVPLTEIYQLLPLFPKCGD